MIVSAMVTSSLRSKTRAVSSVTPPIPREPVVPPSSICSVPPEIVVAPEYELAPVRLVVPEPCWSTEPVPSIALGIVRSEPQSNANKALSVTSAVPNDPPSPICNVPPEIAVQPV